MRTFQFKKRNSSHIAKDRLKLLLLSERIECSPKMMLMLKNDIVRAISKYVTVDEEGVVLQMSQAPPALSATIPLDIKKSRMNTYHF